MSEPKCPRCGAPITEVQAAAGECPACLLRLAVGGSDDLGPGTRVGLYRIVRELGEGGMGVVYLAEQETPIRRRVALKVIKRGMDSRKVVARFEAERQALALMDHPAVARVYEAGETDDGRPFFAMEYVDGDSITAYCDTKRLGTRRRLELFGRVCQGIQHAHRRGIIHRDIKPSNVLVAEEDGQPTPKIIDFGVAKAVEQRLSEQTLFTETGVMLGTPEYMSPEQADLEPDRVDTRTDVYSLGVLLYELLTGALPFDSRELRAAAFDEIRRRIREELPSLPSARLKTLESAGQAAERRRTDVPSLSREVSGDLDAITMKALAKEPSRRYESPAELFADIERHLRNEPVTARPPSSTYQLRKWVSRNRLVAALSGLLLFSLVGFSLAMSVMFVRARAAEQRAEREAQVQRRVTDFMIRTFELSDPSEARGNQITVRELLDAAAADIDVELADEPAVQAALSATMGTVYGNLGLHTSGEPLLRSALEALRTLEGPEAASTLRAERQLGTLLELNGQHAEAEEVLSRNVAALERVQGDDHHETLASRSWLAFVYQDTGRYDEAEEIFRENYRIQSERHGEESPQAIAAAGDLVGILLLDTQYDEAEALITRVVDAEKRLSGVDHPRTFEARFDLATLLRRRSRFAEAEEAYSSLLEDSTRVLGDRHVRTIETMSRLAGTYLDLGKYEQAEQMYLDCIEAQRAAGRGDDHIDTILYVGNLANFYEQTRRYEEAESLIVDNLARRRRVLGNEHPFTLGALNNLGNVYMRLGRLEESEAAFEEAIETLTRTLGEDHVDTLRAMSNMGLVYWFSERGEDAVDILTRTMEGQKRALGPDNHQVAITGYNLAQMRHQLGDHEGARPIFEESQRIRDKTQGETHPESLRNMRKHLALLKDMGDNAAAEALEQELARREAAAE